MKVVFLDFDGVIVLRSSGYRGPDPDAVKRLDWLCHEAGAKVVVSSTWRLGRSVEQLHRILAGAGFRGDVIDKTPRLEAERGVEVMAWLAAHARAEVTASVVLDDDSDRGPIPESRWVLCDHEAGLTAAKAREALAVLNGGCPVAQPNPPPQAEVFAPQTQRLRDRILAQDPTDRRAFFHGARAALTILGRTCDHDDLGRMLGELDAFDGGGPA